MKPIELRDRRLRGGRLSISARTTNKVERRRREAAVRALLDMGRLDVLEALRSRRLRIDDVQRAVEAGDVDRLPVGLQGGEALTLGAAAEELLRKVEATRRIGTYRVYKQRLKLIREWFGENAELHRIGTREIEEFLHARRVLRDGDTSPRPWSANVQAGFRMMGGRLWRMVIELEAQTAARDGSRPRLTINPWRQAEVPTRETTRHEFLLPAEWARVEETSDGRAALAFVAVGCLAGLRVGEAIHLRSDLDVDLEARVLRIQPRTGAHPWRPKTGRSLRTVPISDRLHRILLAHRAAGYAGERYFFRAPGQDAPVSESTARYWTWEAFERAGIKYGQRKDALTFHSLRHTFASWLAQQDVSVMVIAKLLGDTVQMVVTTYAHLTPANLERAVSVLDSILEGDSATD